MRDRQEKEAFLASALSSANVIAEYPIAVLCISIERKKNAQWI